MRLELSQIVIALAVAAFGIYAFRLRTLVADRLIYLLFAALGIVLALAPDLSTLVANLIGIGRGTDLLLYGFVLFSLFHFAALASQLRSMQRQITALTRALAIQGARDAPAAFTKSPASDRR